jgi:hypothetical protein
MFLIDLATSIAKRPLFCWAEDRPGRFWAFTHLSVATYMRHYRSAVFLAIASLAGLAPVVNAQTDPRTLPLLPPAVFSSLGQSTFTFDWSDGAGGNLSYGGGAVGVSEDGNYLYISCVQDNSGIAKLAIPSGGGMARVVAPCTGPNGAEIAKIHPDPSAFRPMLGGVLEMNGRMTVTGYISYDANGGTTASHWGGPNLASLSGPFKGTVAPGMVKSQMAPIPAEWRALLGGPALSSAGYTSIISRASYGASVSVFDPATVTGNNFPMTMLLGCPHSVPKCITYGTPTSNDYNGSELSGGFFIVPGTRTLAVIERESSGPTCYGYATRTASLHGQPYLDAVYCYSLSDPIDTKGPKGYPYRLVAKLYDLNELVAVKQGLKNPWDIRQYATVDMPGSSPKEFITSGAYNPVRGEFYLLRGIGGGVSTVYVYGGNGTPIGTGANSSVPSAPQNLQASVSGSTLSLTWQTTVGAAVTNVIVEAGSAPGRVDIVNGAALGMGSAYVAANVPNGQYYVRLRAVGPGGVSAPSNEVLAVVGTPVAPLLPPVAAPMAPYELRVSVGAGGTVTLNWWLSEEGTGTTAVVLEAGSRSGAADLVPGLALPLGRQAAFAGVPPGVYYVRVRASNSGGLSAPSNEVRLVVP